MMRLILLLSFVLSGCLARITDVAPDYENLPYDNILDNEDFSVFKNPADSAEIYERRPVPKYIDIDKDEYVDEDVDEDENEDEDEDVDGGEDEDEDENEYEDEDEDKIPAFGITREKHNLNKYNVLEAADLTSNNLKPDATNKLKQRVDESSSDTKNEVPTYRNDYGDLKNFKYPYAYPVKNHLPEHDNESTDSKSFRRLLSALLYRHHRKNDTSPYYRRQIWTICANGYRPDSRGRCREILR